MRNNKNYLGTMYVDMHILIRPQNWQNLFFRHLCYNEDYYPFSNNIQASIISRIYIAVST